MKTILVILLILLPSICLADPKKEAMHGDILHIGTFLINSSFEVTSFAEMDIEFPKLPGMDKPWIQRTWKLVGGDLVLWLRSDKNLALVRIGKTQWQYRTEETNGRITQVVYTGDAFVICDRAQSRVVWLAATDGRLMQSQAIEKDDINSRWYDSYVLANDGTVVVRSGDESATFPTSRVADAIKQPQFTAGEILGVYRTHLGYWVVDRTTERKAIAGDDFDTIYRIRARHLDHSGNVLAAKVYGDYRTYVQWFPTRRSFAMVPDFIALFRRRYSGQTTLIAEPKVGADGALFLLFEQDLGDRSVFGNRKYSVKLSPNGKEQWEAELYPELPSGDNDTAVGRSGRLFLVSSYADFFVLLSSDGKMIQAKEKKVLGWFPDKISVTPLSNDEIEVLALKKRN